jgi:hypothetical protein
MVLAWWANDSHTPVGVFCMLPNPPKCHLMENTMFQDLLIKKTIPPKLMLTNRYIGGVDGKGGGGKAWINR